MKVFVNDKLIETNKQYTILQLCSSIGIEIPRFCYHSKLTIAANCRMCLIQVEDSIKPIASCAMGLMEGMRIHTNTSLVKKIRESVLEFLLINHPLDCPICDQGGECDLQDQTLIFGSDRGRFYEKKRAVKDFQAGFLIKTFMTRCIHCTRCIRFNSEIEKNSTLGALGRGQSMKISNYISNILTSPLSGNLIDICPVGALTSKPYAFTARPWELRTVFSVDVSDEFFSQIRIDSRGQEIMRIIPSNLDSTNTDWLSDKARFMFDGLTYQRILKPLSFSEVKKWKDVLVLLSCLILKHSMLFSRQKNIFLDKKRIELELLFHRKRMALFLYKTIEILSIYSKLEKNYLAKAKKNILLYKTSGLTENVLFFNKVLTINKSKVFTIGIFFTQETLRLSFLNRCYHAFLRGKIIPLCKKEDYSSNFANFIFFSRKDNYVFF